MQTYSTATRGIRFGFHEESSLRRARGPRPYGFRVNFFYLSEGTSPIRGNAFEFYMGEGTTPLPDIAVRFKKWHLFRVHVLNLIVPVNRFSTLLNWNGEITRYTFVQIDTPIHFRIVQDITAVIDFPCYKMIGTGAAGSARNFCCEMSW